MGICEMADFCKEETRVNDGEGGKDATEIVLASSEKAGGIVGIASIGKFRERKLPFFPFVSLAQNFSQEPRL